MKLITTFLLAITILGGCTSIRTSADGAVRKCSAHRHGFCFDAAVSGVQVVELGPTARADLEAYQGAHKYEVREVYWEVRIPSGTALEVNGAPNNSGMTWIGSSPSIRVLLYPLNNQKLSGKTSLSASPSVQIGGKAVVTASKTLSSNVLPGGDYIMSLTMRGTGNWDRKKVLLRVE